MAQELNINKLIDCVKEHDELYKPDSTSTSINLRAREKAWEDISEKLNIVDIKELKRRWKSLRNSFQRCLKRAQESENESVTISWPHFEKLLFLKDYIGHKRSHLCDAPEEGNSNESGNYEENTTENFDSSVKFEPEEWSQYENDDFKKLDNVYFDDDNLQKYIVTNSSVRRKVENCNERYSKRRKTEDDIIDKKVLDCLDKFKENLEHEKDSIDTFSMFLSSFIKQWPTEDQCETIKYLTDFIMERHVGITNKQKAI